MVRTLLSRAVVPVASVSDAEATAEALRGRLDGTESVIAVHVVEKAGGAPDKASVEQREAEAEAAFGALADGLDGLDVREEIRYGTDVAAAIVEAAHEHDASAIAFTPRGGSRWVKLLTGDVATTLVEESDVPVVVLPDEAGEET
ncbi:universal stress protein [Halosimplex aquaticum]|uniref:Universal stress protein n=1 Tax=Halosimplex aquaticum TaxID=3026162 RepID=A0ABD5Y4A8_9EURY|nr:universal stress protein [Halosimplex aquaticum]